MSDRPPSTSVSITDWLVGMRAALAGTADSDVACDGCVGCCTSGLYLEIGSDETDALAHIPERFIVTDPSFDDAVVLVEPLANGHCPMLTDGACTIYEHRPRTCRTFDCRVFAATGVEPDADMPLIASPSRRWSFEANDDAERDTLVALRSAVASVGVGPTTQLGLALQAVEISGDFLT